MKITVDDYRALPEDQRRLVDEWVIDHGVELNECTGLELVADNIPVVAFHLIDRLEDGFPYVDAHGDLATRVQLVAQLRPWPLG